MNWQECCYAYLETGWFDHDDRDKTVVAMRHLIERVPYQVFNDLDVLVFAPSQHKFGQIYPFGGVQAKTLIYLSPDLESQPQEEVDFTIAHEFAHAYLGHEQAARNASTIEDEADALAVSWGFILPERRKETAA
jgi:Zn-dependent peptidase ImmA (M78 family)